MNISDLNPASMIEDSLGKKDNQARPTDPPQLPLHTAIEILDVPGVIPHSISEAVEGNEDGANKLSGETVGPLQLSRDHWNWSDVPVPPQDAPPTGHGGGGWAGRAGGQLGAKKVDTAITGNPVYQETKNMEKKKRPAPVHVGVSLLIKEISRVDLSSGSFIMYVTGLPC